jgi:hypothetical protein
MTAADNTIRRSFIGITACITDFGNRVHTTHCPPDQPLQLDDLARPSSMWGLLNVSRLWGSNPIKFGTLVPIYWDLRVVPLSLVG